jgi:hypothetical protein
MMSGANQMAAQAGLCTATPLRLCTWTCHLGGMYGMYRQQALLDALDARVGLQSTTRTHLFGFVNEAISAGDFEMR